MSVRQQSTVCALQRCALCLGGSSSGGSSTPSVCCLTSRVDACVCYEGVQHSANRAHVLLKEANIDFTRTMNKIVFDLHLTHASGEGLMPLVTSLPKTYVTLQC